MSTQGCYSSQAATVLATTTETAALTFTIPPMDQPTGQGVYIDANAILTTGTLATGVTVRVRFGTGTGGALVGPAATSQAVASTAGQLGSCAVLDQTLNYPQGQTYTVTVQQVAASGNGTMQQVTASVAPVTSLVG